MNYPINYRKQILQKLLKPDGPPVSELSKETGISTATLYKWLGAAKSGHMSDPKSSPRKWSLLEKFETILQSRATSDGKLGEWLRERGLHEEHLSKWQIEITQSLNRNNGRQAKADAKKIKDLEKEIRHKNDALAEVTALLILKKKFQAFMDTGDIPQ